MAKVTDYERVALVSPGDAIDPEDGAEVPKVVSRLPPPPPIQSLTTVLFALARGDGHQWRPARAFGPSLEPFARQTGASLGVLGGSIMQNRISKLAGTVLWGCRASRVQQLEPVSTSA